jgi:HK97 gp10 family phage protein
MKWTDERRKNAEEWKRRQKGVAVEVDVALEGVEEFKAAMGRFDSGLQSNVHGQLESWAEAVRALAKQFVPVRTGHLRDSIYAKVGEWVAEIGSEATCALFVEFGTRRMRAQPYLFPAVQEHLPRLEQIVCEAIDTAKAEAGLT